MADEPLVQRRDADAVATLLLNRPDKLNALTPASFVELRGHIDAIAQDDSVRCVVLAGAGRSFCAGNDLASIAAGEKAPAEHYQSETVDALEAMPKPTIARITATVSPAGSRSPSDAICSSPPTTPSSATPTVSGAWCPCGACRFVSPNAWEGPEPKS